jgi:hypothetical protein
MARQFFKVHNEQADATDLRTYWTFIDGMEVTFRIVRRSMMLVVGHCNIEYRNWGFPDPYLLPARWSLRVGYRGPYTTESAVPPRIDSFDAPPWIPGARTSAVILNRTDHYATGDFEAGMILNNNGWYRIELWGLSEALFDPSLQGVCQVLEAHPPVGDPYNQMIVTVDNYP